MPGTESADRVTPVLGAGTGAEPACLEVEGGDVLVMLHRPQATPSKGTAVLICPPFGWQEVCAFRALRSWGQALAGAGFPAARLTLPATGDSAGWSGEDGRLEAWTEATATAAGWLAQVTGCRRVAAVGIGLGGMIACRAQANGAPIDDLVLWGVPAAGRRLLRELRSLSQIIAALHPEDQEGDRDDADVINLTGYPLAASTVRELEQLDLTQGPAGPSGRRGLMLGRDGIAPDAKLTAHLRAAGAEVEVADGRDWADLMANPQQSVAPLRTIGLTLDWLERGPEAPPAPAAEAPEAERQTIRCASRGTTLTETPLWLEGRHGRIFGVLTEPAAGPRAAACAVLAGAGAVPHTGPNRSWVELARRWAALGIATLRLDLGGIGESDGESPELLTDESFNDHSRGMEIAMVLDQLQARGLPGRFILGGLCSGAYITQRLARQDDRVVGLLVINMYAFEWSMQLMIERDRWDRLAAELPATRLGSIDRDLFRRALRHARPDRAWRLVSRASERQQRHQAIRAMNELRDHGVETLLVLSRDEPLMLQLQRQNLIGQLRRWPNLTLVPGASRDHMFRALWYQREIYAAAEAAAGRMLARMAELPAGQSQVPGR